MIKSLFMALLTVSIMSQAEAADCDSDLKQSDGYAELSQKLKCLNDNIKNIEKKIGGPQNSIQASAADPMEIKGCVKTSSLPSVSYLYIRAGAKFCRDNGFVWLRISPGLEKPTPSYNVHIQLLEKGSVVVCSLSASTCRLEDEVSNQRFGLSVEISKDGNGKDVWLGILQRTGG